MRDFIAAMRPYCLRRRPQFYAIAIPLSSAIHRFKGPRSLMTSVITGAFPMNNPAARCQQSVAESFRSDDITRTDCFCDRNGA
jgi:hypothetical protein